MLRIKHGSARESAHAFFDLCKSQVKAQGLDPDQTFFIFPIGGFGEFTLVSSLLHHLRAEGKVALFLPENRLAYFDLFPEAADVVIRYDVQFYRLLPEMYLMGMRKPGYPLVPFTDFLGDGRFNMELVVKEGRLTLKEGYAYMLGLPLQAEGKPARVPKLDLPQLAGTGKKILIIPHANSHKYFPLAVWQYLTDRLKAAGYDVYFENTTYPDALPEGCPMLSLAFRDLIGCLHAFDGVIALRSGLTDLFGTVAPSQRGRLAVVYHCTATPPSPEQRFNHSRGVASSGLAISRIFPGDASIRDFEVDGDSLNMQELDAVADFARGL